MRLIIRILHFWLVGCGCAGLVLVVLLFEDKSLCKFLYKVCVLFFEKMNQQNQQN